MMLNAVSWMSGASGVGQPLDTGLCAGDQFFNSITHTKNFNRSNSIRLLPFLLSLHTQLLLHAHAPAPKPFHGTVCALGLPASGLNLLPCDKNFWHTPCIGCALPLVSGQSHGWAGCFHALFKSQGSGCLQSIIRGNWLGGLPSCHGLIAESTASPRPWPIRGMQEGRFSSAI